MSHISYSVRRNPGGDPVVTERRRWNGWLQTSLAAVLLALPVLPVMAADAPGVSVSAVHHFNGDDGSSPSAALVQGPDGTLYGTTQWGGDGDGTVFKVNPDGSGFQTLHSFSDTDGDEPKGRLVLLNGVLYGTTEYGGSGGNGTVFKINPDGSGFQTLHNFNGGDGSDLYIGLTAGDGVLYGMTDVGGTGGSGTLFKINPDGSGFQTLHNFNGTDGSYPEGRLLLLDGTLYGTTQYGGLDDDGTVFKMNLNGSGFQTLHSFDYYDGDEVESGLTAVDGVLYGTTFDGGAYYDGEDDYGGGTVFKINMNGNGFQTLQSFDEYDDTDGENPRCDLVLGTDGLLYGTTEWGGDDGDGTIFSFNPASSGFQTLHSFTDDEGSEIEAGLIQGIDGNFYGTAFESGSYGAGTVFRMTFGPTTTASLSGQPGNSGWYRGPVTVTLTADDPFAEITHTYYSVDGGPQQAYTDPFIIPGDGSHMVVFHSEDANGNAEADRTQTILIDGTVPTLTFFAPYPPPNEAGWYNGPVFMPYLASDATSGVFSPEADGSLSFLLEGQNQILSLTVTDVAGNQFTLFAPPVSMDMTPPTTTATVSGPTAPGGDFTGTAIVTLNPTDSLSGVDKTYYSVDGGGDQLYTTSFPVPGEGPHTVTFYSVDVAGNVENTRTLNLTTDATAPVTMDILSGRQGAHGWYTGDVQVSLLPTDAGSGILMTFYTIDGGMPLPYYLPFTVSGDGWHEITFYSVDGDGNMEPMEYDDVRIDGTLPTLTFGTPSPAPNAAGWYNADVTVPYTAADATSGIFVHEPDVRGPHSRLGVPTLDGSLTVTGEGIGLTQSVTITDVAGNAQDFTTPLLNIDQTKPVTVAAAQSGTAGQTVTLSATDSLSGVAATTYSVDGGADRPYTGPFTVSGNGDHVVTFHSVDLAGNAEDAQQIRFTVNVDASITTASLSGPQGENGWYTGDVTVTLAPQAGSVPVGATFYTVDGGDARPYTAPFTVSGDAVHTVTYWSVDTAGNTEAQNQQPVKIDATAPALTAGTPSPAPNAAGWNNSPVTVTVTGTDATSGFAGTTPAGPITFSASGKDQTKTVVGKDVAGNAAPVTTPKVSIDLDAPTTTASPSGTANSDGSYTSAATVTLSASDDLSGVAGTTYSVDGGDAQPYTAPFTVSGVGTHTVAFSSTDVAGNAEASKTLTVTVSAPAVPATPVLHSFPAGLQMIAVPESYGSASTALSPAPTKLAVWDPSLVQYTLLGASASLTPGQGYWVRFGQATDLLDNGTPTPTGQAFTVSLQKGWNMIGDPFKSAVSLSGVSVRSTASGKSYTLKTANLVGLISATLYSYPAGAGAYQTTGVDGSLAPYTGYWIYAFQPSSLSIPAAQ